MAIKGCEGAVSVYLLANSSLSYRPWSALYLFALNSIGIEYETN